MLNGMVVIDCNKLISICVWNVIIDFDVFGNWMFDKDCSRGCIDGVVMLVMVVGFVIVVMKDNVSVYEFCGILMV